MIRCLKYVRNLNRRKGSRVIGLLICIYLIYLCIFTIMIQSNSVDDLKPFNVVNLSRWMSKLTGAATLVPFTWLAIPGSHNSGSSNLQPYLGVVPNQTIAVKILHYVLQGGSLIKQWSQTQRLSIREQLIAGIRYFDLRIGFHQTNQEFRFVHGLYGDLVLKTLQQVHRFLKQYHYEIVILDFNRFYDMGKREHYLLLTEIHRIFGQMLLPAPNSSNQSQPLGINLEFLWHSPYRVFVLYHDDDSIKPYPKIWSRTFREHAYAAAFDEITLLDKLQELYISRNLSAHHGVHVWQGISTPNPLDILSDPFSGLSPIGSRTTKAFTNWLKDKIPGQEGVSVCTADFVEKHDFIQTVINLNEKVPKNIINTYTTRMSSVED